MSTAKKDHIYLAGDERQEAAFYPFTDGKEYISIHDSVSRAEIVLNQDEFLELVRLGKRNGWL